MNDVLDVVEPGGHALIEVTEPAPADDTDDQAERALSADKTGNLLLQTESLTSKNVTCLLAMLLDLSAEYKTYSWSVESGLQRTQASVVQKHASGSEKSRGLLEDKVHQLVAWVQRYCNSDAVPRGKMPLLVSLSRLIQVFLPSVLYLKSSQRKNRVHALSIVFLTLASFTAVAAIAKGISKNRLVHNQLQEQAMVERKAQENMEKAAALHRYSADAADGLLLAEQLAATANMTAASLFDRLGSAVTAVPGITLDGMVWVPVSPDEAYDTLAYAINSVPQRDVINISANALVQQIELSGRVSGQSLQDQKRQLDLFTDALKQLSGATAVSILESPVDMALSSESGNREAAHYRLSLQLGDV